MSLGCFTIVFHSTYVIGIWCKSSLLLSRRHELFRLLFRQYKIQTIIETLATECIYHNKCMKCSLLPKVTHEQHICMCAPMAPTLEDVIVICPYIVDILTDTCAVNIAQTCCLARKACTFSLKHRAVAAFHRRVDNSRLLLEDFTRDARRMPPLLFPGPCAVSTCSDKRIVRVNVLEENVRQVFSSVYCMHHTVLYNFNYFEYCALNWVAHE